MGTKYFFHDKVGNARLVAAAVKKLRDKSSAKKAIERRHQPCMDKPVTVVTYGMTGFLQQCLDRCVELAGGNVKFKKVSTPFQDDRIARPTKDDTGEKGHSSAILPPKPLRRCCLLRMARFDLLRAPVDCDQAIFRLMCLYLYHC